MAAALKGQKWPEQPQQPELLAALATLADPAFLSLPFLRAIRQNDPRYVFTIVVPVHPSSLLTMTDTPKRRATDKTSSTPTFVGVGTELVGTMRCHGDLVVGGHARADCSVGGSFTLSEGGSWEGKLHATNAVIAGEVTGELVVAEKLEIRKTARIRGSVSARSIAVAQGALIDGEMSVTSGAPVVRYEEKRHG